MSNLSKPDREKWMLVRQATIQLVNALDNLLDLERTIPDKDDRNLLRKIKQIQADEPLIPRD